MPIVPLTGWAGSLTPLAAVGDVTAIAEACMEAAAIATAPPSSPGVEVVVVLCGILVYGLRLNLPPPWTG